MRGSWNYRFGVAFFASFHLLRCRQLPKTASGLARSFHASAEAEGVQAPLPVRRPRSGGDPVARLHANVTPMSGSAVIPLNLPRIPP